MTKGDRDFFKPMWRRVAVVVFCLGWTIWELSNGETLWAGLSATLAFYCIWHLFVRYDTSKKD